MIGLLLALATPAVAQQAVPTVADSVLRAYRYPAHAVEATAARLRSEFRNVPNVRIVADQRTGQIVVQAPTEVQARIAQRLTSPAPNAPQSPPRPAAPSPQTPVFAGPKSPKSRTVQFWHLTARQVEAELVPMLRNRLTAVPGAGPGQRNYRFSLPGGGSLQFGLDHQTNQATVQGPSAAVDSCVRLIQTLDGPRSTPDQSTRLVSLQAASPAILRRAVDAIRAGSVSRGPRGPLVTMLFQQPDQPAAPPPPPAPPDAAPPPPPANGAPPAANGRPAVEAEQEGALIGPVQIELLEGLDVVIIRGHPRDVDRVMAIIEQIERLSEVTEPEIRIYHLQHTDCEPLAELVTQLYGEVFAPRQGSVSITALVKPNSLLLVGRRENVQRVIDLVKRLDRPVAPETQFRVFRLRYAAAATAQAQVTEFFAERGGLGTRVLVTADFRSNSLIVRAGPRDMAEVAELVDRIDTPVSASVNDLKVFKLENSLAEDVRAILQEAITGQAAPGAPPAAAAAGAEQKSTMLRFLTLDTKGQRRLKSGILTDVRITADTRANALVVSAPAESMELIEALIRHLDQLPAAEAQIKVFTIVNGDAVSLVEMLDTLFAREAAAGEPAVQTAALEGESSLVTLRFAVDVRTNTIMASGSRGDLQVVEAILLRLDEADIRQRKTEVYRLKNAPAQDVSNAINEFLRTERQVLQLEPGLLSPFEQIEREVVVVPEPVSNSLIVSATPRFFDQIKDVVEKLDERPPMVMIQVLIAEVSLNDTDEFGVELGLQDSILFDRSLLGDIVTTTVSQSDPSTGIVTTTDTIQSATIAPGFNFNNQPLGNSGSTQALNNAPLLGSQGLSHFAVGRINNELGFGGFVFSASSEGVSILVRALNECRRLDVLSRPQIMTLDNQPAFVQVGQRVPTIRGTQINEAGQQNQIEYENVGLIMGVTPRISPDGLVVMEIDAEKSQVGPIEEGIPISISATGEVVRSPRIDTTTAQTTVSASDGQTVVLGGLITKSESGVHRKVPFAGDLPIVGRLFRYDGVVTRRTELLIIMTPHIVESEEDAEAIKQAEAARMSWCLCDVIELTDNIGLRGRADEWSDAETTVIYPDLSPGGEVIAPSEDSPEGPAIILPPDGSPFRPEIIPPPGSMPQQPTLAPPPQPTPAPPPPESVPPAAGQPGSQGGTPEPKPAPGSRLQAPTLRQVQPAYYSVPPHGGGVQQAVYPPPGPPPTGAGGYGRPGPVVPLSYDARLRPLSPPGVTQGTFPPGYRR